MFVLNKVNLEVHIYLLLVIFSVLAIFQEQLGAFTIGLGLNAFKSCFTKSLWGRKAPF